MEPILCTAWTAPKDIHVAPKTRVTGWETNREHLIWHKSTEAKMILERWLWEYSFPQNPLTLSRSSDRPSLSTFNTQSNRNRQLMLLTLWRHTTNWEWKHKPNHTASHITSQSGWLPSAEGEHHRCTQELLMRKRKWSKILGSLRIIVEFYYQRLKHTSATIKQLLFSINNPELVAGLRGNKPSCDPSHHRSICWQK